MLNSMNKMDKVCERAAEVAADASVTERTRLYVCATVWHENNNEMLQLLKSIMRLDADQSRGKAASGGRRSASDLYECEVHVFFDDAICHMGDGSSEPNDFVRNLILLVDEAAS